MKKRIFVLFSVIATILLIALACCSCAERIQSGNGSAPGNNESNGSSDVANGGSGQLRLIKSEYKFTQEQAMSQIKAEYLKQNGGYKADDKVVVMVALKNKSLTKLYNEEYSNAYSSVAEFAESATGKEQIAAIRAEQEDFIAKLEDKGIEATVEYVYNTVMNGLALQTAYANVDKIENVSGVSYTMLSDTYNQPKAAKGDASAIINDVEIYPTGIYDSSSAIDSDGNKITGKGTAVAVLDSGFDCSHTVFTNDPNCADSELLLQEKDIAAFLEKDTNAKSFTSNLELYKVYVSKKIPFSYDYADKDYDVFPYDSEHGTHVAGIIGGNDSEITGIAVDTQLVLMKVFPDLDSGGKTEVILAALEDAVLLNVDAINMSLGTSCGFSREGDDEHINAVYDSIGESGISLIVAASNDYSAGFGGAQGNTNKVTNPDSGTVGSPSTYKAALSVASISGTKSRYIVANGEKTFFYKESSSISGDENDFYKELFESLKKNGYTDEQLSKEVTLQYVTVPGVGMKINFDSIDVKGKIALVKRGNNSFEEKAMNAKNAGAIACIIYNNIDGDILMSMGKTEHIPTMSISKSDGTELATKAVGTMAFDFNKYQAGPFMSDFSSWGPTGDLKLKPEITAHGGNIRSAVPNGQYDELSGTSMATPNLCGIVVLIRSYLKDKYPEKTWSEINSLANQLLMSTATIIRNEEGNPYSPRKQGAGLASMRNVVSTKAYLSVDGSDRPKLELGDDPTRSGVYTMKFNVENFSEESVSYKFDFVGMTESVSSSDETFVAETPYILEGKAAPELVSGEGASLEDGVITVEPGKEATVRIVYTLTDADKKYIDSKFIYGMYVEGFVKLLPLENSDTVQLNVPFLAFYGDWTEAPLFDKTYYEVESEAHNNAIDDEDKLKADYYATTPYGSYYYNYIIPLGTYLYTIDTDKYDAIPASRDHIALSNILGTIDGIGSVYAGLLRNAKTMTFTITDKVTGEEVYRYVDYAAAKAHSSGGTPIPYYQFEKIKSQTLGLINNRQYEFKMVGKLDYGDGGEKSNVRNGFSFDFYMDDEAPIIKDVEYEKIYDKTLKKDRYYLTMTVYDNHYVQSITPILFTSSSSYTTLTENPIPVYSEKGKDTKVRFEITDYLDDIYDDAIISSSLAFSIDDYALNSNIFLCQLPGTDGEFKFTKSGEKDGIDLVILTVEEGDVVDLVQYLSTTDKYTDSNKDYLKHLVWSTSNDKVVTVDQGIIVAMKEGKATVAVREQMESRQAVLIINVKAKAQGASNASPSQTVSKADEARIEEARFNYFDTLFAYSRAAQTSEINSTGSRVFTHSLNGGVSFYPGEKIKLNYEVKPWYVKDRYKVTYESTNPNVAAVDENGVVTGLKEGVATVYLSIEGSNLKPSLRVTIKNPFVIENRMLVAYKGLGGNVVIPDDEGILYIGSFAFCLYDTDHSIELDEDDYDANKIPSSNTTITSVIIPDGVQEIQKYAFYNCPGLREVAIPNDVKFIREYAFYGCEKLQRVMFNGTLATDPESKTYEDRYVFDKGNFTFKDDVVPQSLTGTKAEVIGANCFANCKALDNVDLSHVYAIGARAFDGCESLSYADLSSLRNTGREAFRSCTSMESVKLTENTKLAYAVFVRSGLKKVDIYNKATDIPVYAFAQCPNLTEVTVHGDVVNIDKGAFSECPELTSVKFLGSVDVIGELAFYGSKKLAGLKLPNCKVSVDINAFRDCEGLTTIEFDEKTVLDEITGAIFSSTGVTEFVVDSANAYYSSADGLLLDKTGKTIILAAPGKGYEDTFSLDATYEAIGASAFAGATFKKVVLLNPNIKIGEFAFGNCHALEEVVFPTEAGTIEVGANAFNGDGALTTLTNLVNVKKVGELAFAGTSVGKATIAENAVYLNGVFMNAKLTEVTIGKNAKFGLSAFRNNVLLEKVNMPEEGGVELSAMSFAGDVSLKTIDLSKTNGVIARETFFSCKRLMTVNFAGVTVIGDYAFADCANLLNVNNTDELTYIGEGAFSRNSQTSSAPKFATINIPNVTHIGVGAFIGCTGLEEITLPAALANETNPSAFGKEVIDEDSENRGFRYGDNLFLGCTSLTTVNFPAGVKYIGSYAFYNCEKLTTVNNTESVTEIAEFAFAACKKLNSVDIRKVKVIGEGAFASCALTGYVNAPELGDIGAYAFQSAKFVQLNAPKAEKIGEAAFQLNTNLKSFAFGENIKEIGLMPFYGCTALTEFKKASGGNDGRVNDYVKLIDGVLYTATKSGKWQLSSVPAAMDILVLEVEEGTVRVDTFAANENKKITFVVLPDSMRTIGQYAFYGCEALQTVEFRSVNAPALENAYNSNITLTESDPGYELLHRAFDLFEYELCYTNFVDVLGKREPIKMVLPANKDIVGYDGTVYEGYFGKVEDSERSAYVAMEQKMIDFIEYAEKVLQTKYITLASETIVNDALTAYKGITQKPADYGVNMDHWVDMIVAVNAAKEKITALRIKTATYKAQELQKRIYALPKTFTISDLTTLKDLSAELGALDLRDKEKLDLSAYNAFVESYNDYCSALAEEYERFAGIAAYGLSE